MDKPKIMAALLRKPQGDGQQPMPKQDLLNSYRQYVLATQEQGNTPVSFDQFMQGAK